MQKDEQQQQRTSDGISAEHFEKILPDYDGKSIPIVKWLENFEKNAAAYGLSEKQKFVQARGKMTETAKLFLDGITVIN